MIEYWCYQNMAWLKRKNVLVVGVITSLAVTFVLSCSIASLMESGHEAMESAMTMTPNAHQHLTIPLSQPIAELMLLVVLLGIVVFSLRSLLQNIIEQWRIAFRDYRARISEHISFYLAFLFQRGILHPKSF